VGGIARKPGVRDDNIEIREYLSLSLVFDHDVVDGAPIARFISRLTELVEGGFGLPEEAEAAVEPATV
jgi:pyruvate/2-oxoglutarate dehydrogenase complex dihydrolipoamide acyltransferase (E2) component